MLCESIGVQGSFVGHSDEVSYTCRPSFEWKILSEGTLPAVAKMHGC